MIFKRSLEKTLSRFAAFPVIAILGPRQSGKTTLAKTTFKKHIFLSFEDPAIREFATTDPKKFLRDNKNDHGIIIDEFQYVPEIMSYIQLEVDAKKRPGYFVLTGSQNFLMNQAITQSLAGRVGILTLLPLSLQELKNNTILDEDNNNVMFTGGYPRIYSEGIYPSDFYPSYIQSYVERDVRQLINVGDLRAFQTFLKLCAARIGQLLNISDLAMNCGISAPTARRWLSILEASYVIFLLQPHFKNYNKRLVSTPKLFFYDTGLASNLLDIPSPQIMSKHIYRGHLFENMIISDLAKQFFNNGRRPSLYFWRDRSGRIEIDCVIDLAVKLQPIEIKAAETISSAFFNSILQWNTLSGTDPSENYIIYAGDMNQARSNGKIIGWKSTFDLVNSIYKELDAQNNEYTGNI